MPQFEMDADGEVNGQTFEELSPFLQGYIEAMLFTSVCSGISMVDWNDPENVEAVEEGTADGSIPGDSGFGDIYPDSLIQMHHDCSEFQQQARHLLSQAYGHNFPARIIGDGTLPDSHRPAWDYDAKAAGRDFWYTRNGHGVGFWDRDLGDIGDKLSDIARKFGEVNASFGDVVSGDESPTGYGFVIVE
jgi:hypothetical protein